LQDILLSSNDAAFYTEQLARIEVWDVRRRAKLETKNAAGLS
jgi:hypothetical protein